MSKLYYNNVLLPALPAGVLETYPYCFIRKNTGTGYYDLIFGPNRYYYDPSGNANLVLQDSSLSQPWYRVEIANAETSTEWTYNRDATGNFGINGVERTLFWSNHDIFTIYSYAELYFVGTPLSTDNGDIYYAVEKENIKEVANAIRYKTGKTNELEFKEFSTEIRNIMSAKLQEKTIVENGEHLPDSGYDGIAKAIVNVPIPDGYVLPSGSVTIYTNGEHNVSGKEKAIVNVPTSGGDCTRPHVIEVDELPTEDFDENAVYLCNGVYYKLQNAVLTNIVIVSGGYVFPFKEFYEELGGEVNFHTIPTKTTEGIRESTGTCMELYYIKNEADIFMYAGGEWGLFRQMFDIPEWSGTIYSIDEITDITTDSNYLMFGDAQTGYYSVMGTLEIEENGTYDVRDKANVSVTIPAALIVQTVDELPSDAPTGSLAYALDKSIGAEKNLNVTASCSTLPLCHYAENYYSSGIWVQCNKYWFPDQMGYGMGTQYIWTDGTNIYYSYEDRQCILNKDTGTWDTTTWNGFADSTEFYGNYVWSDGTDIYYSKTVDGGQYVLAKGTNTWEPMTWNGLTDFNGEAIWTDGTNIYHSYGADQYVLNKETNTWEPMPWNGLTEPYAFSIWTDGINIYYSGGSDRQYVLDKETHTWEPITWNGGYTGFYSSNIWSDGSNIYLFSDNYGIQYRLNKNNNTWEDLGTTYEFPYYCFWTDGANIFATDLSDLGSFHYMLLPTSAKLYEKTEYSWRSVTRFTNCFLFYIDGVGHTAESGMTWGEWIESRYNFDLRYENIYDGVWDTQNEVYICTSDGTQVDVSAKIVGTAYILDIRSEE